MTRKSIGAAMLCSMAYLTASGAGAQLPTQSDEERQANIELGLAHETAFELYETLQERAGGGDTLQWDALPDWSGVWSRPIEHIALFDPAQDRGSPPTAQLTPEYQATLERRLEMVSQGFEYDRLGRCDPPGVPRWFTEPFLREHVITPDQTWLLNEVANEVRRVYTDGRGHLPESDRFATWDGDSIGFWNDRKLVIHTNQLSPGEYTRGQPDHTDQVEVVEIWEKVDDDSIVVDVWVYDPPALAAPWYVRQHYEKLSNDDGSLRIHYWHCFENQNNDVFETDEGGTDFVDFDFTDIDDD